MWDKGMRALLLLCLLLAIAACSTVREISDLQALSERGFTDMSDAELKAMEERPLPGNRGLELDLALMRRTIAAALRGNMPVMRETAEQAKRIGTSENLIISTLGIEAYTEWTNGDEKLALRRYAAIEERLKKQARKEGRPVYADATARTELGSYLYRASRAMDFALAERLVNTYFLPALQDSALDEDARFYMQQHLQKYQISKLQLQGDPKRAFQEWQRALQENDQKVRTLDLTKATERNWERHRADFYLMAGLAALQIGRMDEALEQLERLEALDLPTIQLHIDEFRLELLWNARNYQAGYKHLKEMRRRAPPAAQRLGPIRAGLDLSEAKYLAALGRWEEVERLLKGMLLDGVIGQDKGLRAGLLTFAETHLGHPPSELKKFKSMEPVYRSQQSGVDASIYYYAAKTYVFTTRAIRTGSHPDLKRAVDGGRQLSRFLRIAKLTGGSSSAGTSLPETILDMSKEAYLKAASLGVERGAANYDDLLDALQLIQSSKTERDIMAMSSRLTHPDPETARLLKRVQDAQKEARGAQARLAALVRDRGVTQKELQKAARAARATNEKLVSRLGRLTRANPQAAQLLETGRPLRLREIQGKLSQDAVLVSIGSLDDSTLVTVVTRNRARYHRAKLTRVELKALVDRIRDGVTLDVQRGIPEFDVAASHELYSTLLHWARSSLAGKKTLYLSTNGALASVPFGLLVKTPPRQGASGDHSQSDWLIRQLAVVQVPSLPAWIALHSESSVRPKGGFIAWADPAYASGNTGLASAGTRAFRNLLSRDEDNSGSIKRLPADLGQLLLPLPETLEEAQGVARALGASPESDIIRGTQATRSSVLSRSASGDLAKRNVLMFATHGLVPGQVPGLREPALAMANEGRDPRDMLLTLEDVAGLRLDADWVILSACSTASADEAGGDPFSGLARGFFYAGAKGLMVTQWEVETESAKTLTTKAVANYAQHPRKGHGAALQRAMLDLIKAKDTPAQWSHPAFWAPFVFVGGR